ncbi:MAG: 5-oxoprolinase subunit PxpB [Desulfobacterales bacterium]|jgi:KipI family sensor histidine kinase inhibitor
MRYDNPAFRIMGDRGLLVELGDEIHPEINQSVQELYISVDMRQIQGVVDLVPSYRSLLIVYNPLSIGLEELQKTVLDVFRDTDRSQLPQPKTIKIPVVYGGVYGPDLQWVADFHHIATTDVIAHHLQPTYRVYMIGFTPGYPYLGELPDEIVTPRRETPRTIVPKGSVGIAQRQTGIYSVESPGGWQIIGWTPVELFDPKSRSPSLLTMGDRVRFHQISEEEAAQCQS